MLVQLFESIHDKGIDLYTIPVIAVLVLAALVAALHLKGQLGRRKTLLHAAAGTAGRAAEGLKETAQTAAGEAAEAAQDAAEEAAEAAEEAAKAAQDAAEEAAKAAQDAAEEADTVRDVVEDAAGAAEKGAEV